MNHLKYAISELQQTFSKATKVAILLVCLGFLWASSITQLAAQGVNFVIDPPTSTVDVGETFTVNVNAAFVNGGNLNAVAVYLDFDETLLEVINITYDPTDQFFVEPVTTTPATANMNGQIGYEAGSLSAISTNFPLLSIEFQALAATNLTNITFTNDTDAQLGGTVLLATTDATVTINEEAVCPTLTVASQTNPSQCGGQGSFVLTFTDVPNGTYTITHDNGQFNNVQVTNGTATINAPAGTYENLKITVEQCTSDDGVNVILSDPSAPTIALGNSNDPNTCGGQGSFVLNFTGVPDGNYTINHQNGSFPSVSVQNGSATINAPAGNYNNLSISVNGCSSSENVDVTLTDPTPPTLSVDMVTNPSFNGGSDGSFRLTGLQANTTYELSYSKDGENAINGNVTTDGNGNEVVDGLSAGSYTNITVTLNNCTSNNQSATLNDPAQEGGVNFVIDPANSTVEVGDAFTVNVNAEFVGGGSLNAAAVYLDFDETLLEVINITYDPTDQFFVEPVTTTPATANMNGQIGYEAGSLSAINTNFPLLSIEFQALAATNLTNITFADETDAQLGGSTVLLNTTDATVTIEEGFLVINEVDYDQAGTDNAEFIELYNPCSVPVNLDGYIVEIINGAGNGAVVANTITLPDVMLAAGDYYVICANGANTANCDLDVTPNTDLIQNGAPDAIGLRFNSTLVDALSYEGNTGAPYTETAGAGTDNPAIANRGLSRFPNGVDTDDNSADFIFTCITPGEANAGPLATYYADTDMDGFGDPNNSTQDCTQPTGFVTDNTDCDDTNAAINPNTVWYADLDEDNYSDGTTLTQCTQPMGYKLAGDLLATSGDCDDTNAAINPNTIWYADLDGDNYSDGTTLTQCTQPIGYKLAGDLLATSGDCDDNDNTVYPGAPELCDGKDNDCDNATDEEAPIWYADADGDGFGDPNVTQQNCTQPMDFVADNTDCDDIDGNINPNTVWYADLDNDDYSDGTTLTQCLRPMGYKLPSELSATSGDCDDSDDTVYPGAPELCDGKDNDCDNATDEEAPIWYADADGDGFGDPNVTQQNCTQPMDFVADNTDCDDGNTNINPNTVWYKDVDGDDYSDGMTLTQCTRPTDYYLSSELIATSGDCDDTNSNVNPGAPEILDNGIDDNCNDQVDEVVNGTINADFEVACEGDEIFLTFNATAGAAPFTLVINGETFTNVADGGQVGPFAIPAATSITFELTSITDDFDANVTGDPISSVELTITESAKVEAGEMATICRTKTLNLTAIGAAISGGATDGTWGVKEGDNDVEFSDGANDTPNEASDVLFSTAKTFKAGAKAAERGYVTLVLTSDDPDGEGPCQPTMDEVIIKVQNVDCGQFPWKGNN